MPCRRSMVGHNVHELARIRKKTACFRTVCLRTDPLRTCCPLERVHLRTVRQLHRFCTLSKIALLADSGSDLIRPFRGTAPIDGSPSHRLSRGGWMCATVAHNNGPLPNDLRKPTQKARDRQCRLATSIASEKPQMPSGTGTAGGTDLVEKK